VLSDAPPVEHPCLWVQLRRLQPTMLFPASDVTIDVTAQEVNSDS
jgi:hypothetical protein